MAIKMAWYLEKRIVCARVYGILTPEDDRAFDTLALEYLQQGDGDPIHLIVDYSELETIETIISAKGNSNGQKNSSEHPALGCRVTFGNTDAILKHLAGVSSHLLKPSAHHFHTFEDSIAFLQRADTSLPLTLPVSDAGYVLSA